MTSSAFPTRYAVLIPALNEAQSIGRVLAQIPNGLFTQVIVVDNGSEDGTAEVARVGGAWVVREPRRGYGRACLAGLNQLHPETAAVAFMDADLADDPGDLARIVRSFDEGRWDLVLGSRVLGNAQPGSLTPLQRFGNSVSTLLIRWLWHMPFTDLGPMRMISRRALGALHLQDPDFGWNVEMQAKAARLRMRVCEIPVSYRRRASGRSKISGTLVGSIRAGFKIVWTIYRCWRIRLDAEVVPTSAASKV